MARRIGVLPTLSPRLLPTVAMKLSSVAFGSSTRDATIDITSSASHYTDVYRRHNAACRAFFTEKPGAFLARRLNDPSLFADIHEFVGLPGAARPPVHANRSSRQARARLDRYLRRVRS